MTNRLMVFVRAAERRMLVTLAAVDCMTEVDVQEACKGAAVCTTAAHPDR